jgi:hypothetical protein
MSYDRSTRGVQMFTDFDLEMHVELGMGTKHAVKGSGTMSFHWSQEAH